MDDDKTTAGQPSNTPLQPNQAADVARHQVDDAYKPSDNPYQQTHQDNYDWRQYHTAWQQYYQKYYERYYWLQLNNAKQKASGDQSGIVARREPETEAPKDRINQLRADITNTVKEQAVKVRRSRHFVPIVSALAVGLLFLFLQFNSVVFAQVKAYVSPGAISDDALILDPNASPNVGQQPRLIIPKINVDVPVDYSIKTTNENEIQVSLRDGATHYRIPGANAVPGQLGNTILLGHSSNDIFNQGSYKFVFVLLDRLKPGDLFYLHYHGTRYIYRVTEQKVIDPSDVEVLMTGKTKAIATLITCTPPGTAFKRLLVFGEQISPDPSGDKPANSHNDNQHDGAIPGNEPSWLDNIWNSIF